MRTRPGTHSSRYLYAELDDSFLYDGETPVRVELTYLDTGCTSFRLEYDSTDPGGSVRQGAFKPGDQQIIGNSGQWKTAAFTVRDGRFVNRCNGADLRFAIMGGELTVRHILVRKLTP